MIERIGAFFAAPGRQAIGWAALGIIGVALAGGGLLLFSGGGDGDGGTVPANNGSVTPSLSASAITSPSASATRIGLTATAFALEEAASRSQTATAGTPSPSTSPSVSPSTTPIPQPTQGQSQNPTSTPQPAAVLSTPTPIPPTATPPSTLAYCPNTGGGATPPNAIFGNVTIDGVVAPAGTTVTIAFDGVPAVSTLVTVQGNAAGYRFLYGAGGGGCSNHVGAGISIIVNGQSFGAPTDVGGSEATLFNVAA